MNPYPTTVLKNAPINDLSWLTGVWIGEMDGARIEEHWSTPDGATMMCMFRWIQGNQVRFYEFVTIEQEEESVVLRIKHFNPGLIGWEEKTDSITFSLVQLVGKKAAFIKQDAKDGLWLVYQVVNGDTLIARFESGDEGSKPASGEFIFKRVKDHDP